jgi:hypothetical protein
VSCLCLLPATPDERFPLFGRACVRERGRCTTALLSSTTQLDLPKGKLPETNGPPTACPIVEPTRSLIRPLASPALPYGQDALPLVRYIQPHCTIPRIHTRPQPSSTGAHCDSLAALGLPKHTCAAPNKPKPTTTDTTTTAFTRTHIACSHTRLTVHTSTRFSPLKHLSRQFGPPSLQVWRADSRKHCSSHSAVLRSI